jgi:protein O-GlcNAc transferase
MGEGELEQLFRMAVQLHGAGRLAEAERIYRQILEVNAEHVGAIHHLGVIAQQSGRYDAAIELISKAIRLKPDVAEAHSNLGIALMAKWRVAEAIEAYRRAIQIKPDFAEAYSHLASAMMAGGRLDGAIASCRKAIELKPGYLAAYNNLGIALKDTGQIDESIAAFGRAAQGGFPRAHANLLMAMMYDPKTSAETIFAEHQAWARRFAKGTGTIAAHSNDRNPERRLRVGYVSSDFRGHPVAFFVLPLLEHHDHANFEIYGYSHVSAPDKVTERAKRCCDEWRDIVGMTDEQLAERVRADCVDILVDLTGHTGNNRLLAFARKPAPVQVTYLGYPNTTGIEEIDYRLTDGLADPPGAADGLHVEKLWRLPGCAWCYEAPEDSPEVRARGEGPVTFGCFNTLAKINDRLLELWAEILIGVPGSRLLLKSAGVAQVFVQKRMREVFASRGVAGERIEMMKHVVGVREHLALYGRVDVALDTFPYHGTMTTCEALWMGTPVASLVGRAHVSRVGLSLLTQVGLADLAAVGRGEYVRIARELANDSKRVAEIRGGLRERMKASALMDSKGFAMDVEKAYREMWRGWCAGGV